jgi:hypothetical protein
MWLKTGMALLATLVLALGSTGCSGTDGRDETTDGDGGGGTDTATGTDGDTDGDTDSDSDSDTECYDYIDIVFVIDVSTTMSYILDTLYNEIGVVWDAALQIDPDPHFGLVVFVDDTTVTNSGQTYTQVAGIQAKFKEWYNHTSSNEQTQSTATNGDWPENTLDALAAATADFAWRDQAKTLRVIIHATDDTFLEKPASFSSGIKAQHTYAETVTGLQGATIRVASFTAKLGGISGNANVQPGFSQPYKGQTAIPQATSGQVYDIDQVGTSISLADAINDFVINALCEDYVPE